jgi:outer membrane protein
MYKDMKYRITFLFCLAATVGFSQDNATPTRMTFRDAVKLGLDNNVRLQQEKNLANYTDINKTSSLLRMGPSVEANGMAYRNDGNSFNQNQGRVVNGVNDFVNGSISASMPLFSGLRQVNAYRAADNANDAQLHRVVRTNQDVIRDVANQYLVCLLDYQLVKIDEQNVATQKVQYDQIATQVDVGSKAEADLYNQDYQVKNAELALIRSKNKLKNDKAILAATIQIDPSIPFELEDVDWDINTLVADSMSLQEMYATGLDRRSDLKEAQYSEKAAQNLYSFTKGSYYPVISAGASYGSRYNYIYDLPSDAPKNRSFDEQFRKDNRLLSYGVSVTIPIYYGLANRAAAANRKALWQNAQLTRSGTEVTVKSDIIRAHQNFVDAQANFQATTTQLRAAELSYKTEKERYDLGISNIVQLTTANQAYTKAQGDYQNSLFTLMFQKLLTNYATGTLRMEDIP